MKHRKIKIFIASTYSHDCSLIRTLAVEVINELNKNRAEDISYIDLTIESASDNAAIDHCLEHVEMSDYMILIMGKEYGSPVNKNIINCKSFTHMEYEHAVKLGIPVLVYCTAPMFKGKPSFKIAEPLLKQWYEEIARHSFDDTISNEADGIKDSEYIKGQLLKSLKRLLDEEVAKLPYGISVLTAKKSNISGVKYKDYLDNSVLPYASREDYKNEMRLDNTFLTEKDLYKAVFLANKSNGLLIVGPGGIGKTRLMKQLGFMAQEERWKVLEITRNFQGWDSLFLRRGKKYCLIFDYIEENKYFNTNILEGLSEKYLDIEIKVIANARKTYLFENDQPIGFYKFDFTDEKNNENEKKYATYVIKRILEGIQINQRDIEKYINKPAFATFLLQGYVENKINFHEINEFSDYIRIRLANVFDSKKISQLPSKVFYILICLSSDNQDDTKQILKRLKTDAWINQNENQIIKSLHDSIYDEILIEYFKQDRIVDYEDRVRAIHGFLQYAKVNGGFSNTFTSFEHISEFIKVDWMQDIFIHYIDEIKMIYPKFIKSSLLSNFQKLFYSLNYLEMLIDDDVLILLAKAMKTKSMTEKEHMQLKDLYSKLMSDNQHYFLNKKFGSYLISGYYEFFGVDEFIQNQATQWLEKYHLQNDSDFVITQYLEKGGDVEGIKDYAIQWSKKHYLNNVNFSHMASGYLKYTHDLVSITPFILEWLKLYIATENASFMIQSYLDNGGDLELIKEHIIRWLDINSKKFGAHFFIQRYLDSKCNIRPIKEHIIKWLEYNNTTFEANYIIQKYLDNGGDIEFIKEHILRWLNAYDSTFEANYIIQKYLDNGGDIEFIKEHMLKWLNTNDSAYGTYIIQKYLDNGGDIEFIKEHILRWLKTNDMTLEAYHVMEKYLKKGGDIEVIKEHMLRCSEFNVTVEKIGYLLFKMYKIEDLSEKIENHILRWLQERYIQNPYFSHLLVNMLANKKHVDILQKHILFKLENVPLKSVDKSLIYVFLNSGGVFSLIEDKIVILIKNTTLERKAPELMSVYLSHRGNFKLIEENFSMWLQEFSSKNSNTGTTKYKYSDALYHYLKYGGATEKISTYINIWLKNFGQENDAKKVIQYYISYGGNYKDIRISFYKYLIFKLKIIYDKRKKYIEI